MQYIHNSGLAHNQLESKVGVFCLLIITRVAGTSVSCVYYYNSLGLVVNDVRTKHESPKFSKPNDMTIGWKALNEHIMMVPLVLRLSRPI
jgi:hypothetical protein